MKVLPAIAVTAAVLLFTPGVAAAATVPAAPTVTELDGAYTIGEPGKVSFSEPAGSPVPASFVYRVNEAVPAQVAAGKRTVTVKITPTRAVNILTVYAVEPDGTLSDSTTFLLSAVAPPPFADQDYTGDGKPDLLTVGPANGLEPGIWLVGGRAAKGNLRTPATRIASAPTWPAPDFDGAQVLAGKFSCGSFNDVLVYYPTGINAGMAIVTPSLDDGRPLDAYASTLLFSGTLTDLNGDNPLTLASAYDSAGSGLGCVDLLGISGDPVDGYTLNYYPNVGGPGGYGMVYPTPATTPTGGTDWDAWHLASALLPSGTAVLLWNATTGATYLWESVTYDGTTVHYTQYELAANWQPSAASVQLTQDGDGNPLIWTVSATGAATAYLITHLSPTGVATLKPQPAQPLLP